jgi:UDP-glucose 4-epimerase
MTSIDNSSYWKDKRVLVTGGAGFIGSHLVERLLEAKAEVIVLDNYFTGTKDNHIAGATYYEGHTKDIAGVINETPDILFHLGEYARVEKSFDDVALVWELNMQGTQAVLEFCRARGCKMVYAGSSTKFAHDGDGRNMSPYAWSKATNTELVKRYGEWFNVPYAITYFYNVYGGRERGNGQYATLIGIYKEKIQKGEALGVVSPGTQMRNFTHIDDTVDALIRIGEKGAGDEYGISSPEEYSILEVAQMFGGNIEMLPERAGNRNASPVVTAKTRELGWIPKRNLKDYIAGLNSNQI